VGVYTLDDIKKIGPAGVYLKLKSTYPKKVWPVCYYLYSLEGALTDTYWDDISRKKKEQLLKEVGR
jgi:DNA transformation protein